MSIKTYITKIHYDKNAKGFLFSILKFASFFYGIGSTLKNFLYDCGILKPYKVNAYVISVGNLTTGGVGKTPVVAEIAKYLINKGETVAIVSRGYGGKLSNKNINVISDGEKIYYSVDLSGDEPYWLAENTKAIVITSKNRISASEFAIKNYGVTKIILDDGFQHRKLYRNLDIVLSDSDKGFGNDNLLPAGPLREGVEAIKRIDRLIIVSKNLDHSKAEKLVKIMGKKFNIPSFLCRTEPDYVYNIMNGQILSEGEKVTALCAIGQPDQFYKFLENFEVIDKITFDDHHQYCENDIEFISTPIITTEKDAVKLKKFNRKNIYALKLKSVVDVEKLLES